MRECLASRRMELPDLILGSTHSYVSFELGLSLDSAYENHVFAMPQK